MRAVLAKDRESFDQYLEEQGLREQKTKFINSLSDLYQLGFTYSIIEYDDCYKHPLYRELKDLLLRCQSKSTNRTNYTYKITRKQKNKL